MSDAALRGRSAAKRRIVETIVADIALQRSVPHVFLLNESGRPTAWSAHVRDGLPRSLRPLLDMYFAQDPAHRGLLTELVDVDGIRMSVRIMPHHLGTNTRFALIVEPFVLRTRSVQGSGELTPT